MRKLGFACLVALSLGGCATTPLVTPPDRPRLDAPDASVMTRCARPITVPDHPLTQAEVEAYWGRDTDSLIACGERQRILADYIRRRDGALTSSK
jgi:hypothetical protein